MEKKKIFIPTRSKRDEGSGISLSGDKPILFDHGAETIGSIVSYDFQDPYWAVNREQVKNYFLGMVKDQFIEFYRYDAQVALKEEKNLPDGQLVFFSVVLEVKSAYAANIEVITSEHRFTGKVRGNFIVFDDYDWPATRWRWYESANIDGQAVSFNIAWDIKDFYAVNVKTI